MALQVPAANDRKRVKVYELKESDWFDRGTGFCTGQFINVSVASGVTDMRRAISSESARCLLARGSTADFARHRKNLVSMSNPKITQSACCSKHRLAGMMLIRSNKVIMLERILEMTADFGDRHTHSMDGTERD